MKNCENCKSCYVGKNGTPICAKGRFPVVDGERAKSCNGYEAVLPDSTEIIAKVEEIYEQVANAYLKIAELYEGLCAEEREKQKKVEKPIAPNVSPTSNDITAEDLKKFFTMLGLNTN